MSDHTSERQVIGEADRLAIAAREAEQAEQEAVALEREKAKRGARKSTDTVKPESEESPS